MIHRSKLHSFIAALVVLGVLGSLDAKADCAGASTADTKRRYAKAQEAERAGKLQEAFGAYVAAQEYTCEPNPVELPAAQRAAELGLKLGKEAETRKDLRKAFQLYNDGGQYAQADRVLMALVRANPDDPSVYIQAREALEYRASPAFQSNEKVRLGVTGAYAANPQNYAEVQNMPAIGAERAFKAEADAFNEQYLREYVELIQSRPDDATDQAALQRMGAHQQAFHRRWPNDPIKASRKALELAHGWSAATTDRALADKIVAKRRERLEQRALTLTRSYDRAPELLDAAIDYQMASPVDEVLKQQRAAAIRTQAAGLGDQAAAQKRYGLAAEYYSVADLDAKADAAREQQRQLAMAKMQPTIDTMRKQAEDLQKTFSDPDQVKAMQEQARQAQQTIQAQQQANAKANAKKADDLEKELGL